MILSVQGTARTLFCVIVAFLTFLWLLMLALAVLLAHTAIALPLLLPTTIMAGLTFGAYWTLMSVTTSELFGLAYFSVNYSTVLIAPMLASYLGPTLLLGRLYDAAARRQHPHAPNKDIPCFGMTCFLPAVSILCFLSFLVRPDVVVSCKKQVQRQAQDTGHTASTSITKPPL